MRRFADSAEAAINLKMRPIFEYIAYIGKYWHQTKVQISVTYLIYVNS